MNKLLKFNKRSVSCQKIHTRAAISHANGVQNHFHVVIRREERLFVAEEGATEA